MRRGDALAWTNDNHYHGVYLSGPNNVVHGNVVRHNGAGFGIHLYTGFAQSWQNNNLLYGNLTYGHTNAYGFTIWGAVDDGGSLRGTNYLYNNTILDGVQLSYGKLHGTNNIIMPSFLNPTEPVSPHAVRVPTLSFDYNLSSVAFVPTAQGSHDVVTATPGFVNSTNGLYWLTGTSPARATGRPGQLPYDFWGNAPWNVSDIGAFKFGTGYTNDMRTLDPSGSNPDYWLVLQDTGPGVPKLSITGKVTLSGKLTVQ